MGAEIHGETVAACSLMPGVRLCGFRVMDNKEMLICSCRISRLKYKWCGWGWEIMVGMEKCFELLSLVK